MDKIDLLLQQIDFPIFYLKIVLSFVFSFLITWYSIPTIIKISRRKNLMDEPGQRSSHERKIPNLGGIAMFFSIAVCASIFAYQLFDLYKFLFASLVILLYVANHKVYSNNTSSGSPVLLREVFIISSHKLGL